jgi:hypothetical protein
MYICKVINNEKLNGMKTIILTTNSNSPFVYTMNIVEETEKALKIENEYKTYSCWIPKSALQLTDDVIQSYTFKMWFRKIDNGSAIDKAFRLFN